MIAVAVGAFADLVIAVALTVDGDAIHVDLEGTSPQIDLPINMPFEGTVDIAIYLTLRAILLDPALHDPVASNEGLFRPITISAPEVPPMLVKMTFSSSVDRRR